LAEVGYDICRGYFVTRKPVPTPAFAPVKRTVCDKAPRAAGSENEENLRREGERCPTPR